MEHLSDRPDVTLQEDRHRPVIVCGHLVQEPPAGLGRAVQLLRQHLHPLDDVELLLGVDEGLQEEGGGQPRSISVLSIGLSVHGRALPGRHQGDVIHSTIRFFVQSCRKELNHLEGILS